MGIGELIGIGNLCSTGKKENSSGSELYINIINIPSGVTDTPTKIIFLSNIKIENFNDLLNVCQFYEDYSQRVILIGGEYVQNIDRIHVVNRLYINRYPDPSENTLNLSYRYRIYNTATKVITYINTPPENWTYINISLA